MFHGISIATVKIATVSSVMKLKVARVSSVSTLKVGSGIKKEMDYIGWLSQIDYNV